MENPLISVIVPVYNIEKYIRKCVESILGQTYKNIEIILVDDGSTDGSSVICDELGGIDARVRVLHTANAGQSSARNLGIKESKGDYITFVDGDDYVTADYVRHLYDLMEEHRADISMSNHHVRHEKEGQPRTQRRPTYVLVMSRFEALEILLHQKHFGTLVCGRLFQRSLFDGVEFPCGKIAEDMAILYRLFDKAETIVYSSIVDYVYVQRATSSFHAQKKKFVSDYIDVSEEMKRYIECKYPNLTGAVISRCFSANVNCLRKISFGEIYGEEYANLRANIVKYRKSVLANPNAPFRNRGGALLSYFGVGFLKTGLAIYKAITNRE
jgi:glycosyltransferase involved in cell wall biosynthesis